MSRRYSPLSTSVFETAEQAAYRHDAENRRQAAADALRAQQMRKEANTIKVGNFHIVNPILCKRFMGEDDLPESKKPKKQ